MYQGFENDLIRAAKAPSLPGEVTVTVMEAEERLREFAGPPKSPDYALALFVLKAISDRWDDHHGGTQAQPRDPSAWLEEPAQPGEFAVPGGARFGHLYERRLAPGNASRLDGALRALETANPRQLGDVFQHIRFETLPTPDETKKDALLRGLIEVFARPEMDMRPAGLPSPHAVGVAYGFLLAVFAQRPDKGAGPYFLQPDLEELMAELVAPKPGADICDPVCGSGGLLLACAAQTEAVAGAPDYRVYGQESDRSAWAHAKLHLALNGIDNRNIEFGDAIGNPKLLGPDGTLKQFDVVLGAPPLLKEDWGHEVAEADTFGRFRRGIPPRTIGDYAYILHLVETMKPDTGRLAVIAPHGVLFRRGSEARIRQALIEENILDAVIGLPERLFIETPIPVALLVFRKDKTDNNVLFIDASKEYAPIRKLALLTDHHADKILRAYRGRRAISGLAYLATSDEIEQNAFNLNISRYVGTATADSRDLSSIQQERESLKATLVNIETRIADIVSTLRA